MATDGNGCVYSCTLISNDTLEVLDKHPELGETRLHMTLICGCLQGDTARDIVSSAVQLGARRLLWVRLSRSQDQYSDSKLEKLHRIAIQSTKQTGRARLLVQSSFANLKDAIQQVRSSEIWVAHPAESDGGDLETVDANRSYALVIGAEGGFDESELELLKLHDARFVRLGQRRLRSEAAAAAGLMLLLMKGNEL